MLISELLSSIRNDYEALGQLGGSNTAVVAERLSAAIEPALRSHFLGALNNVIQEFNLDDSVALTLNLEGDQVRMVRAVAADADVAAPAPSDYSARIALRLSNGLKGEIENLAIDVGSSVNTWIVRTLERSVRTDPTDASPRNARQLRGKGRA